MSIPAQIRALVGRSLSLTDVAAAVAACAARAGDGDVAAALAFAAESGSLAHGWAGEDVAQDAVLRDVAVGGPAAWKTWRETIQKADREAAAYHPNGWGIGILPPEAGEPFSQMTGSGRTVWAALPGGALLRVTTRRAPGPGDGRLCHVVAVSVGEDVVALVATERRVPGDEAEALAAWPGEDVGADGPTVIASRAGDRRWTFRPAGLRAASACAEARHVDPEVVREAAAWSACWSAGRKAQAARAAEERALEAALGRRMPIRRQAV